MDPFVLGSRLVILMHWRKETDVPEKLEKDRLLSRDKAEQYQSTGEVELVFLHVPPAFVLRELAVSVPTTARRN